MREECWFADQPLLLTGVFTGSADLRCDHLERAQWGPARCAVTKVLMQERVRNITVEAADTQLTLPQRYLQPAFQSGCWLSGASLHMWTHREYRARSDTGTQTRAVNTLKWYNTIRSVFRWYYKRSYCLVDDSFDSSLHICRIVHIDHPHIWLSYGLGVRVLWCHLQSETLRFGKNDTGIHRNTGMCGCSRDSKQSCIVSEADPDLSDVGLFLEELWIQSVLRGF